METIILLDYARIRSLGIFRTFDIVKDEIEWFRPECAYKFLVVDGRLVIAPINDHTELYAVYSTRNLPLDEAKAKVEAVAKEQYSRRNFSVRGAGMIGADGKVTGWKSGGFSIETPVNMREEIELEVARLFQNGDLEIAVG